MLKWEDVEKQVLKDRYYKYKFKEQLIEISGDLHSISINDHGIVTMIIISNIDSEIRYQWIFTDIKEIQKLLNVLKMGHHASFIVRVKLAEIQTLNTISFDMVKFLKCSPPKFPEYVCQRDNPDEESLSRFCDCNFGRIHVPKYCPSCGSSVGPLEY